MTKTQIFLIVALLVLSSSHLAYATITTTEVKNSTKITTVTCSIENCFFADYAHVGTVRLDLVCDKNSPSIVYGVLVINTLSIFGYKVCSTPSVPATSWTCDSATLSSADQAKLYTSCTSTVTNSCKDPNPYSGRYICDATGKVTCSTDSFSPPEQYGYGTTCPLTSAKNACGKTNTADGIMGCNNTCTGTPPAAPSNATCAPFAPTLNLYKDGVKQGTDFGASVPAYDSLGYKIYAKSTSLAGYKLTYYFEFSIDGENWSGGKWATLP